MGKQIMPGYRIIIEIPVEEGLKRAEAIARSLVHGRGNLTAKVYGSKQIQEVPYILLSEFNSEGEEVMPDVQEG